MKIIGIRCNWVGCASKSTFIIQDFAYCPVHYFPAFEKHFFEEYKRWDGETKPPKEFLRIFSRYVSFIYGEGAIPCALSRARIRDRAYNIRKTEGGLTFCIVRHLYAWTDYKWTQEVEQFFKFTVDEKKLELLSEDPDDEVNKKAHEIADALCDRTGHPAIMLKQSKKHGKVFVINSGNVPEVISKTTGKPIANRAKRLKAKIGILMEAYSLMRRVNYGRMLAYQYQSD
jgi:hypothetical protein